MGLALPRPTAGGGPSPSVPFPAGSVSLRAGRRARRLSPSDTQHREADRPRAVVHFPKVMGRQASSLTGRLQLRTRPALRLPIRQAFRPPIHPWATGHNLERSSKSAHKECPRTADPRSPGLFRPVERPA
jgi:hypothetical protein